MLRALTYFGGVNIGDSSDGSGDCGLQLSSLASSVLFATAIVARMLKGLGGRFTSLRPDGIIGSCRTNPYGIVGSFELSLIVNIRGSVDAIDDTEGIRPVCCSDSSVELRILGELFLRGLGSFDICSTSNTSESVESSEMFDDISKEEEQIE